MSDSESLMSAAAVRPPVGAGGVKMRLFKRGARARVERVARAMRAQSAARNSHPAFPGHPRWLFGAGHPESMRANEREHAANVELRAATAAATPGEYARAYRQVHRR